MQRRVAGHSRLLISPGTPPPVGGAEVICAPARRAGGRSGRRPGTGPCRPRAGSGSGRVSWSSPGRRRSSSRGGCPRRRRRPAPSSAAASSRCRRCWGSGRATGSPRTRRSPGRPRRARRGNSNASSWFSPTEMMCDRWHHSSTGPEPRDYTKGLGPLGGNGRKSCTAQGILQGRRKPRPATPERDGWCAPRRETAAGPGWSDGRRIRVGERPG